MSILDVQLNEEQLTAAGLDIMTKLDGEDIRVLRRLMLDRNTLLVRMKIIALALEDRTPESNTIEEVAKWAREAYDTVVLK